MTITVGELDEKRVHCEDDACSILQDKGDWFLYVWKEYDVSDSICLWSWICLPPMYRHICVKYNVALFQKV